MFFNGCSMAVYGLNENVVTALCKKAGLGNLPPMVCFDHLLKLHFCPLLVAKLAKLEGCAYFSHVL